MARSLSLSPAAPTKTFVLEVHADSPSTYLERLGRTSRVQDTEDAFLQVVHTEDGDFWVDHLDERFWSFHTDMTVDVAHRMLRELVTASRDVDWMWLPSQHLRHIWPGAESQRVRTEFRGQDFLDESVEARDLRVQLSGHNAEELLDLIAGYDRYRSAVSFDSVQVLVEEPRLGAVSEGVTRMGRFAVSGDAFDLHLQFVRRVVQRYHHLVSMVEQATIAYEPFETGGGTIAGQPIVIQFDRSISDMDRFLSELFSAREPFRLWGVPVVVDGTAEVEAVDLHVGDRLRMDVGRDWLRVYLGRGACGNSVVRLVSNLQHRFDGALRVVHPEIQAALEARNPDQLAVVS